jgi:hypothetical protein
MMFSSVTIQNPMGGKVRRLGKSFTAVGAVKDIKHFDQDLWHSLSPACPQQGTLRRYRSKGPPLSHHGAQHVAGLRTKCHTNADFVRALAYAACLDAEKPKAYRFLDCAICR